MNASPTTTATTTATATASPTATASRSATTTAAGGVGIRGSGIDRWDGCIMLVLFGGYLVLLLNTVGNLGYARDEGFYFQASHSYGRWFELLFKNASAAFERKAVDSAWAANSEHPALMKSLFALSNFFLQRRLGLFSMEGTSYRFPAMVLSSFVVALVYLWGRQARDRAAGIGAALALGAIPSVFYHAHLACFDAPIMAMWTCCAYLYWRAVTRGGVLYPVLVGVAFGLTLNTKHNSWFLPIACIAHAVGVALYGWWTRCPAKVERKHAIIALFSMAVLGPLVFYALWPWIWHDTLPRLRNYALFHLRHDYYNMEFFGETYWTPPMPRSYAPVMTLVTVPAVTLALCMAGLWAHATVHGAALLHRDPDRARPHAFACHGLWLIGLVINYAAWLSPNTPIFGGTKHWMTAYPFLALFAGAGFSEMVRLARALLRRSLWNNTDRLTRLSRGPLPALVLGAITFAGSVVMTFRSHPWGLSAYTPLAGGAAGAATWGFNRTFWGYTTGAVVDYLNREVPRGGTVYIHDTAYAAWDMLLKDGRLRKDIRAVGTIAGADFGLYHHEMHMLGQEYQNWVAFGTVRPDHIAGLDGVPVIWIYRRAR